MTAFTLVKANSFPNNYYELIWRLRTKKRARNAIRNQNKSSNSSNTSLTQMRVDTKGVAIRYAATSVSCSTYIYKRFISTDLEDIYNRYSHDFTLDLKEVPHPGHARRGV